SRRDTPELPPGVTAVRGDLATGDGLATAVAGIGVIAHCASSPFRWAKEVDVAGTRRLVEAAGKGADAPHLVYVSIVGVDKIPLGYYKAKLAAEGVVSASGLPFTILRATQFHELIDFVLGRLRRLPVRPLARGFRFQPIAATEAAARMAEIVAAPPVGFARDIGGPEVRDLRDLA